MFIYCMKPNITSMEHIVLKCQQALNETIAVEA